jgi:choline dehydrogenase-like flavoprotein
VYCIGQSLISTYGPAKEINANVQAGNSFIRHSRAKVLGGCSSHNTLISFKPFAYDCKVWEAKGCYGWSFQQFNRLIDQLRNRIQPVHPRHRNQICKDWIQSCSSALEIPVIADFNKEIASQGGLEQGVGFFSVAYNPEDSRRSSSSVAYLHPIIRGEEKRSNLTILVEAWVSRVNVEGDIVTGVNVSLKSGEKLRVNAKKEVGRPLGWAFELLLIWQVVLSAGAVDTPRLLLLSGIGPKKQLVDLGIPVVKDIPGVGENLLDHPESIIMWELNKPIPQESTMDSDAGVFLRREARDARGGDGKLADMMMHCYQIPFCLNTARYAVHVPPKYI